MEKLMFLLYHLSSSAALAQAVAPLPPPAATLTPAAVRPLPATPTGTGLYLPGSSNGEPVKVKRSPNKRVLPPTKEPGLWAADAVGAASDVPVSRPDQLRLPESADPSATGLTAVCLQSMSILMEANNLQATWSKLTAQHQRCTAAYLIKRCADARASERIDVRHVAPKDRADLKANLDQRRKDESNAMKRRTAELVASECKQGAGLGYGLAIRLGDLYALDLEASR